MLDNTKKLFRWGPIDAALLPLAYPMMASFDMMQGLFDICWPESLIIFDRDKALWLLQNEDVQKASEQFVEKTIFPDRERGKFLKVWNDRVSKLLKIQDEIGGLFNLSNEELNNLISEWNKAYLDFWAIGMTAELINYPLESRLKGELRPYFSDERDLNEAFATLSTPTETSFYKEEEKELMEISLLKGEDKETALKNHQRNYFWIYNNYFEGKVLDLQYFKGQIKNVSVKDAKEFLAEINGYKERILVDKENLIKELGLPTETIKIISLLNDFILFQDIRKKYNLMAAHYLEEFLKEGSRRTEIKVRDLKWLLPNEFEGTLSCKDLRKIIENRKHLTIISIGSNQLEIFTQNKASKIEREFNEAEFEKSVNLQGTVACTGKHRYFRGIAKVIQSPKEGEKLKAGEILVTTMTTPDFVMVMKKAGAIITDIGGVTCHAAVVSREFGIPCIVGTQNATKIIKDGDILELHNLRGTVKIVSE